MEKFKSQQMNENNPNWEQCIKRENSLYKRGNSYRSEFERDYTRVLHCLAYRRLKRKTQVFYAPQNDHICTRIEHVNHVASVSKTIAKNLGLNTELTEAIALGHDIGHAPFGHTGEEILNSLITKQNDKDIPKKFWHERNSLFFADYIETLQDPEGAEINLDLTYAVRDGLICHCGEIDEKSLKPRQKALDLYDIKKSGVTAPYTWEGCVVKIADKIAFLGRDIEDAKAYNILDAGCARRITEIVKGTLGFGPNKKFSQFTTNGVHRSGHEVNTTVLINDMIVDLCEQSSIEEGLKFSEPYFKFIKELKSFCFSNIYNHWRLVEFKNFAAQVLGCIYRTLIKTQEFAKNKNMEAALSFAPDLCTTFTEWLVKYSNYDIKRKKQILCKTKQVFDINDDISWEKCIIEYISGMTDDFAIKVYKQIIWF